MPDMDPRGNVELPGVYMEGQEVPTQVIEIDDTNITQDPSLTSLKVPS